MIRAPRHSLALHPALTRAALLGLTLTGLLSLCPSARAQVVEPDAGAPFSDDAGAAPSEDAPDVGAAISADDAADAGAAVVSEDVDASETPEARRFGPVRP